MLMLAICELMNDMMRGNDRGLTVPGRRKGGVGNSHYLKVGLRVEFGDAKRDTA